MFRAELNTGVPGQVEDVVALGDINELLTKTGTAALPAISAAIQKAKDQNKGGTVAPVGISCDFKFF